MTEVKTDMKVPDKTKGGRGWMALCVVLSILSLALTACENFQLPQTYDRPCGASVDTTSPNAGIFTSPHDVNVYAGSKQQFWPEIFDVACTAVKYSLSKPLGSVSADGLYTAPATITGSSDSVMLIVQSYAKTSLVDTLHLVILPPAADSCIVTTSHYSTDVLPILQNNCLSCHSTRSYVQSGGGVDLDSIDNVRFYVNNGLLLSTINYSDTYKMPRQAERLDTCSIKRIRVWIEQGAQND